MGVPHSAALYMRMSTEKQDYSISHQRSALEAYALARGIEIVRVYQDEGKSGLEIKNRVGLLNLLDDVQSGNAPFDTILVFDISRWGRFQDVDESAHYEYMCRRAGVRVEYCAELFTNDDSPISSLLKSIKRTMAAEYSRELSAKVFYAQCRFARKGYKQGGSAGYGLRRMLVAADGTERGTLKAGQRKGFASDRVIFTHGPANEVALVRRIYRLYIREKMTQIDIARLLNKEGIENEFGRDWTLWSIKNILSNEKYIGTVVFNRKSTRLRQKASQNPREAWIKLEGAFAPIVSKKTFEAAQAERARRSAPWTSEELLDGLLAVHTKHGAVNAALLAKAGMPNPKIYIRHFGSLAEAYLLAGLPCTRYVICGLTKLAITAERTLLIERMLELATKAGGTAELSEHAGVLVINESIKVKVAVIRCRSDWGRYHWRLPPVSPAMADFYLYALMDEKNTIVTDYYLIPAGTFDRQVVITTRPEHLQPYHRPSLGTVFGVEDFAASAGCGKP